MIQEKRIKRKRERRSEFLEYMRKDGTKACIEVLDFCKKGSVSLVTEREKAEKMGPSVDGYVGRFTGRQMELPFDVFYFLSRSKSSS